MNIKNLNVKKIILKNTFSGILCKVVETVTAIVTIPIIIKSLGVQNYGLWVIISQIIVFFGALDFGITNSIGRYVAKYKGQDNRKKITEITYNALVLLFLFSMMVIMVTPIIILNIELLFNITDEQKKIAPFLIIIIGFGISLDLILRVGRGVISGFHRFDLLYNSLLTGSILKLSTIVIIFHYYGSSNILLLGIISVSAMILPNLIMIIIALVKVHALGRFELKIISKSHLKDLLSLGFANVLNGTINAVTKSISLILVANILSINKVALLSIPLAITIYPSMFVNTFLMSLTTIGSELKERTAYKELKQINLTAMRYSFAVNIAILAAVLCLGNTFLILWIGESFKPYDIDTIYSILIMLMIGYVLRGIHNSSCRILNGLGKHWVVSIIGTIDNLFAILLGYLLLNYSTLGIISMPIGWLVSSFIISFVLLPIICKLNNLYMYKDLIKNLLPTTIYMILIYALFNQLISNVTITTWHTLVGTGAIYSITILVLINLLIFEKRHRINFFILRQKIFKHQ